MNAPRLPGDIREAVARALAEDVRDRDISAALVAAADHAVAEVTIEERAILCGTVWFDEVFRQLDTSVTVRWQAEDGQELRARSFVCRVSGPARALLSGERTALNFLQTLSATATSAHRFAQAVHGTGARILDTRKTLPGLRTAQKYAVRCGGAFNHRAGLFDAVLIKENHIAALGGVAAAVKLAIRSTTGVPVFVEVEDLEQLGEALETDANRVLLDNLALDDLREGVRIRDAHQGGRMELEASGGVDIETVRAIAETGVDWISVGAITKNLSAINFSMRFV